MEELDEKKAKRRLQNRLAQQRFRDKLKVSSRSSERDDDVSPSSNGAASSSDGVLSELSTSERNKIRSGSVTLAKQEEARLNAWHELLRTLLSPSPCAGIGQLFMPQFHFAHALDGNAARMGISKSQIKDYWCISTIGKAWRHAKEDRSTKLDTHSHSFPDLARQKREQRTITCATSLQDEEAQQWRLDHVPANMQPTDLQRTVEHHPYIDVAYPWPVMRDRILLLMDVAFDEDELCHWTLHAQERVGEPAFTIWGDDLMDESAYELSETFVKRWWFLLDQDIVRRTNWWRRQRGLHPIVSEWIL